MGYESIVFVAEPGQLATLFPGWKPALAAPITRTAVNSFTNEPMTMVIETVDYDEDDEPSTTRDWWDRWREAAPPSISREISPRNMEKLARAMAVEGPAYLRALSEPPDSETTVFELVAAFVEALATASPERHPALGRALRDDLDEANATALLARLIELARKAQETHARLYVVEDR